MALRLLISLVVCAWWSAGARAGDLYKADRPAAQVTVRDAEWHDAARDRDVPVRIYVPAGEGKHPLVVFSHGLGASRERYGYFGHALAEAGYVVIAPTHRGSDTEALRRWSKENGLSGKNEDGEGWMQDAISEPDNLINRPKDISFVIDKATADPALAPLVDADRIGVAGHSFGAYTAMAIGGMSVTPPGKDAKAAILRDPRVKAALPMSPQGAGVMGVTDQSWDTFAIPVLFLTGTKDYGSGGRAASWRRQPFDHVKGVDAYLFTIDGATHMTFGGPGANPSNDNSERSTLRQRIAARVGERIREKMAEKSGGVDPDVQEHVLMIESYSTAFFDAYLQGNESAKAWLVRYGGAKHEDCASEFKPAK